MKVRSLDELDNLVSGDLAIRKREVKAIVNYISSAREHEIAPFCRSGFVLLYAHFEGFIKHAGSAYLAYISHQHLSFAQISTCFAAAAVRGALEQLGEVKKASRVIGSLSILLNPSEDVNFYWSGDLSTRSNLDSETFREIIMLLGLDYSRYATREKFIDVNLVKPRHEIAHGSNIPVERDTFAEAERIVLEIMEQFRTDILNAAVTEGFKRKRDEVTYG